jgi:hypothetical protein
MPSQQPGLLVLTPQLVQRQAQLCHGIKRCEPSQMLLERAHEAFRTAVACRCADQGRRTGDPHNSPLLLQAMGPILPARLRTPCQGLGASLRTSPTVCAYPLAHGLQGFTPAPLLGGVAPHTRRRVMSHRATEGPRPVLPGVWRRPRRPPMGSTCRGISVPSGALGPCGRPGRVGASRGCPPRVGPRPGPARDGHPLGDWRGRAWATA